MNIFRSSRTAEAVAEKNDRFKAQIIAEKDDDSNYPFGDECDDDEDPSKKAEEMENILGNALTITERSNGSILSLRRSGTNSAIEMGRRIASMRSPEEIVVSDAHLNNHDTFSYISRSSSLQSVTSLPTFIKVEGGDPVILAQQSWDAIMSDGREDEEHNNSEPTDCEGSSPGNINNTTTTTEAPKPKPSERSWNKLRRQVDEEAEAARSKEETTLTRTPSIGRKGFSFKKKSIRASRSNNSNTEPPNSSFKEQQNDGGGNSSTICSDNSVDGVKNHISTDSDSKKNNSNDKRSYAKDYGVEVCLQERNGFWGRRSSRREAKGKKAASTTSTSNSKSYFDNKNARFAKAEDNNDNKIQTDQGVNTSFDTLKTDVEDSDEPAVEETIVDRSKIVVEMHELQTSDLLFEALELVCCHCADDGETLDMITDMVPPYV